MGICQKCGNEKMVRDHHVNGYGEKNKDFVIPYCRSCDIKAHNKARKEGRCELIPEEVNRLSTKSHARRSVKRIMLSRNTLGPCVQIIDDLRININTGNINIYSCFIGTHYKKLKIIYEK